MKSNAHSANPGDELGTLAAAVDALAAEDWTGLPDRVLAERVLRLRRLVDRLEDHWVRELAYVDPQGAAEARLRIAERYS